MSRARVFSNFIILGLAEEDGDTRSWLTIRTQSAFSTITFATPIPMSDHEDSGFDFTRKKDSAAVLPRKKQLAVKERFGDSCMLCGYPQTEHLEVAPILARRDARHVRTLRPAKIATALHSKPDLFRSNHYDRGRVSSQTFAPLKKRTLSAVR